MHFCSRNCRAAALLLISNVYETGIFSFIGGRRYAMLTRNLKSKIKTDTLA